MIRKSSEILLKDAIEKVLKQLNLEDKLNETRLIGSWEQVAGKLIARHTRELYIQGKVLYVKTDMAALKQELTYMKTSLIDKLNKEAGAIVIEDLKLL
jgi:predicted nucleic acid-binding Zn ribbon protein